MVDRGAGVVSANINDTVDAAVHALAKWREASSDLAEALGYYVDPVSGLADHRRARWGIVDGVVRLMSRARGMRPPLHGGQERHGVSCDSLSAFPTHSLGHLVIVNNELRDDGAVMQRIDAVDMCRAMAFATGAGEDPEASEVL